MLVTAPLCLGLCTCTSSPGAVCRKLSDLLLGVSDLTGVWTTGTVGVEEVKVSGGGIDITGIPSARSTGEFHPVLSGVLVIFWRIGLQLKEELHPFSLGCR